MTISTVGVIGLGTMGAGIAEVIARNGYAVVAVEGAEDALARGRASLEGSTGRAVARGKLTAEDQAALLARITFTTDLADLAGADLVVEAVSESLDLKKDLFARVDAVVGAGAILASNTSSLSVTDIAVATQRPANVVGIHFFNPAPVQAFVEVVRTVVSSQDTVDRAVEFARSLGKQPVVVDDKAGFIANALLFGYLNHAVSMYESRYATREDIDAAMRLGCGYPMGPLMLLDLIGLDTAYEILDTMYKQGRDRLHAPSPILKQMVTAGHRGRKSGRGFYAYEAPGSPVVVDAADESPDESIATRDVRSVGVVGSGTMASGIVEVFAKAGMDVVYVARGDEKVAAVRSRIEASTAKAVERGKLEAADRDAALARITGTSDLADLASVDLVVEAVVEDLDVKLDLFARLDGICRPGAVLATTTSSLPVIDMAAVTTRPEDVVGLHFFNPATLMRLVEVVRTVATSDEVVATATAVCRAIGKHPVECGDRAGFIVNALLFPYLNDSVRMLQANYASADDIDLAMKKGCGYPMGPFELLDVVGLDVSLAIQQTLYREFREPGFAPAPRLEHLVTAGYLGRKTGRGFRDYA
ncbi:MAG: 3-hydroxybutyryl-CoA dehydrogenase [Actinomycetota bacterium]|jgi:3-hydroxybutyryl-CoA dehydrogenase|nr:3-hydroxybutyryl-CoA dehydrogenase [Actinomycetota bacterium]